MNNNTLHDIIWTIYRPHIEKMFKDHPDKDEILRKMEAGELSFSEIDQAFDDAELASWKKLFNG